MAEALTCKFKTPWIIVSQPFQQQLNLDNNNIRDEGANSLAKALKHNSTLQELDLDEYWMPWTITLQAFYPKRIGARAGRIQVSGRRIRII